MSKKTSSPPPLTRPQLLQLTIAAILILLPYVFYQHTGISIVCMLLLVWRLFMSWHDREFPRWLVLLSAICALGLVVFIHGNIFGRLPGLAILSLLLPLKLLEARTRRDGYIALMLMCFLINGQFILEQTIWLALSATVGTLGVLSGFNVLARPKQSMQATLKTAMRLALRSLPVMVVLFFVFPRVDGPFWGVPLDAYSNMTGLSDHMSPGSISSLALSSAIAFRAEFKGDLPPSNLRYWRGPVLTNFDGKQWSPSGISEQPVRDYQPQGPSYHYTLTLEADNQRWLLAMDFPQETPVGRINRDFALVTNAPVRNRMRYELHSFPQTPIGLHETPSVLTRALALPQHGNPRTRQLGQRIAAQYAGESARLKAILDFMRNDHLLYTLNPPLQEDDTADMFLFDAKQGFCEHFSAAFVVLARSAGIPARVVTGYQGGEINPVDNTLVIRQSDAHAWAEVWLEGRGWIRIDPTAESFPQRIDEGMLRTIPPEEARSVSLTLESTVLRSLRNRWEAVSNTWNQWILGYNARRQQDLMKELGLRNANWKLLTGLTALTGGLWMLWLLWPRRTRRDALDTVWQQLCQRLADAGLARMPWEAPTHYAERIARQSPQCGAELKSIAERYATLRFGTRPASPLDIQALRQAARQLKISL